jgi:hypothetical protein
MSDHGEPPVQGATWVEDYERAGVHVTGYWRGPNGKRLQSLESTSTTFASPVLKKENLVKTSPKIDRNGQPILPKGDYATYSGFGEDMEDGTVLSNMNDVLINGAPAKYPIGKPELLRITPIEPDDFSSAVNDPNDSYTRETYLIPTKYGDVYADETVHRDKNRNVVESNLRLAMKKETSDKLLEYYQDDEVNDEPDGVYSSDGRSALPD